jgi:hypothetical protein
MGYSDTLVRWYYNHMASRRINCDLSPVAKLRCPCQALMPSLAPQEFVSTKCFHFLYKFLARSLNFFFAGKFNNRWLRVTEWDRLSLFLCIQVTQQGEKYHRSNRRTKLYLRMPNSLLNSSILAIYGLWKSSEIVLLTNRSQNLYYSAI